MYILENIIWHFLSTIGEVAPTWRSSRISEKVKESPVKTLESESKKKPKRYRKSKRD